MNFKDSPRGGSSVAIASSRNYNGLVANQAEKYKQKLSNHPNTFTNDTQPTYPEEIN